MKGLVGFAKRSTCALVTVTVTVNWWWQWCDFPLNAHTMFPGLILLVASASGLRLRLLGVLWGRRQHAHGDQMGWSQP